MSHPTIDDQITLTLTLAELKKKVPELDLYTFVPGSVVILTYDQNCSNHQSIRILADQLRTFGVFALVVGYDGSVTDNPISIFEVKK